MASVAPESLEKDRDQKQDRLEAIDRAARELIGTVESVRFRGESGYTVIYLKSGSVAVGSDAHGDLRPGLPFRFLGKWTTHAQHGEQFAFLTFVRHEPHDRPGVIAYLEKMAPHVGKGIARRLWDAYGSDAVAMLRTRPDEVAAARIMPLEHAREAADRLQTYAGMEAVRIELWGLFAGRGFPRTLIEAVIERWGLRAPRLIRRDPFRLMIDGLPGCGFLRCDALYLDLGHPPHRLKRQMLCCWRALDELAGEGHTWAQVERVAQRLTKDMGGKEAARPRDAIRLGIRSQWLARRRDESGQLWLAIGTNARQEVTITAGVRSLLDWRPPTPEEIQQQRDSYARRYEEDWDDP